MQFVKDQNACLHIWWQPIISDEPLYKRACCKCCAGGKMAVPYRFAGYQREEIQPAQKEQFMGMLLSPKNDSQSEKN